VERRHGELGEARGLDDARGRPQPRPDGR
jgi:hypothetical protein